MMINNIGIITRRRKDSSKPESDFRLLSEIESQFNSRGVRTLLIKDVASLNQVFSISPKPLEALLCMSRSRQILNQIKAQGLVGVPVINSPGSILKTMNRSYLFSTLKFNKICVPYTIWPKTPPDPNGRRFIRKSIDKSFTNKTSGHKTNGAANRYIYQERIKYQKEVKIYLIGKTYFEKSKGFISRKESLKLYESSVLCQKLLGLMFLSIDFLIAKDKNYIVDVNDFPSYESVENASTLIVDEFLSKFNSN